MKWNEMEEEKSHRHAHKLVSFLCLSNFFISLCYVFLFWTFRFRTLALSQTHLLCVVRLTSSKKWTAKRQERKRNFALQHIHSINGRLVSNNESSSSSSIKEKFAKKEENTIIYHWFGVTFEWIRSIWTCFPDYCRTMRFQRGCWISDSLFSLFFNWIFSVDWFEIVWAYAD